MKISLAAIDKPLTFRGTRVEPGDAPEQYLQKLARIALDEMACMVWVMTADGTLLECNRAALTAGSVTREEVVGRPVWETAWWAALRETGEQLREAVARAAQREPVRYELPAHADQSGRQTRIMEFTLQPVVSEAGEVALLIGEGRDLTEPRAEGRKLAGERQETAGLQELRDQVATSQERLRLAQAAAQVGTWEWDASRDTSSLSPELHRIFGTVPGDPESKQQWMSRVHPQDWPHVQQCMEEGYRAGHMDFDYRYRHPQAGLRWLYCKGRRVDDGPRMVGIVQDITERKLVEEAAHRLAAIVESSDDAIVSKDLNGIVTSWNKAAEKMFGYTASQMVGAPITTIIPPELHGDERRILSTIASGGRIEHFETVRVTSAGEKIEVSLTISPVKDDTGRIIGAAKIARDITQRKKTEQALRTTERLASVGRLAATVAHEINNPLEAVTNLVFLAREHTSQEEVRNYLARAEEELDRVSLLTKQTLGFYRETRGVSLVKLEGLIKPLIAVFASRTRNKSVDVNPEFKGDPEIEAVPGEIRQLLANLLSNSIDAVDGGGRIRIRVSGAREWSGTGRPGVRITVADSGAGIPATVRPKIFEPFFTTKKEIGTGLGLWVCKSIVEKHHGSIRLKSSTMPGKSGTAFAIFLPCSQPQLAEKNLTQAV